MRFPRDIARDLVELQSCMSNEQRTARRDLADGIAWTQPMIEALQVLVGLTLYGRRGEALVREMKDIVKNFEEGST